MGLFENLLPSAAAFCLFVPTGSKASREWLKFLTTRKIAFRLRIKANHQLTFQARTTDESAETAWSAGTGGWLVVAVRRKSMPKEANPNQEGQETSEINLQSWRARLWSKFLKTRQRKDKSKKRNSLSYFCPVLRSLDVLETL